MSGGIGLAVGAVVGVVLYRSMKLLETRVEREDTKRVLGIVALVDLVSAPLIGFLIGAYLWPR